VLGSSPARSIIVAVSGVAELPWQCNGAGDRQDEARAVGRRVNTETVARAAAPWAPTAPPDLELRDFERSPARNGLAGVASRAPVLSATTAENLLITQQRLDNLLVDLEDYDEEDAPPPDRQALAAPQGLLRDAIREVSSPLGELPRASPCRTLDRGIFIKWAVADWAPFLLVPPGSHPPHLHCSSPNRDENVLEPQGIDLARVPLARRSVSEVPRKPGEPLPSAATGYRASVPHPTRGTQEWCCGL
jgi:hypothetical protein